MVHLHVSPTMVAVIAATTTQSATRVSVAKEMIQRWGFVRTAYALLMNRLRRYTHLNFCRVTTRLLGNADSPSAIPASRSYRELTEEELIRFSSDTELELTPDLIRTALKRGDICVGAVENNRLVGYTWFAFNTAPHLDGVWVTFPAQARYAYKTYVKEEFRGGKIASDLNVHGDTICLKRGKAFGIGFIDTHNYASYRSVRRVGARTVGYAGYFQCFGRTFIFRTPGARRYGFRFYRP